MTIKHLLITVLLLALAGCARIPEEAAAPAITGTPNLTAGLLDFGVYETLGDVIDKSAPSTAAGRVGFYGGLNLLRATDTLKAERGVAFGFRFQVLGKLDGEADGFEMHVIHPPMRGVDGNIHTSQTAPIEMFFEDGFAEHDFVYLLSEPFEILPGNWTLQILYKGVPILSKRFTLT